MRYLSSQVFLGLVLEFLISYTPSASRIKHCSNKTNGQNCKFDHRHNILWCDSTTFTSLPPPNEIHGEGDPRYAETIYLNSSCQQNFRGVLRQYAHVKQLNYDDNMIQTIPKSCFSHLHLDELILSRNSISTINSAFNGNTYLLLM
uniref:LRRNT domain-containing protein n=1 Tax=Ciona intestinalis TaxID=7719 RepID=F6WGQ5_CIOIN